MVYGLYYCCAADIVREFKHMPNVIQQQKHASKHANRVYKNNQNIRRKGSLKQPGGSSCNQRR